jgi:hypothetical protein
MSVGEIVLLLMILALLVGATRLPVRGILQARKRIAAGRRSVASVIGALGYVGFMTLLALNKILSSGERLTPGLFLSLWVLLGIGWLFAATRANWLARSTR